MMKNNYTVLNNEKINLKIKQDLNYIVNNILNIINKDVLSIYLVGGFGRGEGGVIILQDDIKIVNDYDIFIVTKRYKYIKDNIYSQLKDLSADLANKLNVKQIDLQLTSPIRLLFPLNTIDRYEKKYGNMLLYGKKTYINFLRPIPLIEGTRYLYNRGNGLLLNYLILKYNLYKENKIFLEEININNNKAYLAIGDCILIADKEYNVSYAKRLERINFTKSIFVNNKTEILKKYRDALNFKIKPSLKQLTNSANIEKEYYDLLKEYNYFIKVYEKYRKEKSPEFKNSILNRKFDFKKTFNLLYQIQQNSTDDLIKEIKHFLKEWHNTGITKKVLERIGGR